MQHFSNHSWEAMNFLYLYINMKNTENTHIAVKYFQYCTFSTLISVILIIEIQIFLVLAETTQVPILVHPL